MTALVQDPALWALVRALAESQVESTRVALQALRTANETLKTARMLTDSVPIPEPDKEPLRKQWQAAYDDLSKQSEALQKMIAGLKAIADRTAHPQDMK